MEKVKEIIRPTQKGKKYTAIISMPNGKTRKVSFGAIGYTQFKDSTPLKMYSKLDHNDSKRRERYFQRHSGVSTKSEALAKERSNKITAKWLSHKYLW